MPDGDTGTNLTLTAQAIVESLEASTAADRAAVAKELTRAALMGARGNSGVIFSQIVRGAAEVLGEPGTIDATRIRRAFRGASDAAYRAVRRPVEGTMLSVIRELAEEGENPRHAGLSALELFRVLVARGEEALARTPEQLAVLREAGVVDAGGAGLLEIVRGISATLAGEPVPEAPAEDAHEAGIDAIHQELSAFRYCTVFVVEGEELDADALETELEQLGDSLLVVGDRTALKIHVHTDEPGAALALATALGTIEGVEIANMHKQTDERSGRILESVLDSRGAGRCSRPRPDPRDRRRRRRSGRGQPAALRELRRDSRDRGRSDDEPLDRGHRQGDRGHARNRSPRAAEQLERDPLGRAGGEAGDEARARDSVPVGSGRAGGDRPLPALARRRRERDRHGARRSSRSRRAR